MAKHLLLLHGAIGASDQLQPLADTLRNDFNVHLLDFEGHGGREGSGGHFSIARFAENVVSYLEENDLEQVSIFGYSMGGYVGAYVASLYPDRIDRLATLATKWHWDEETAARETANLDAKVIREKVPKFADALAARHTASGWTTVLRQTTGMLRAMGEQPPLTEGELRTIQTPVLVMVGDKDKMVSLAETEAAVGMLPNARLGVLPGTPHPVEAVEVGVLAERLQSFF